jgi:maltoporin
MSKLFKSLFCLAVAAFVAMPAVSASADDSFEFHGYMRAGTSFNEKLNQPNGAMQVPYANKKYRLGNEADNLFIETQLQKNWKAENGLYGKMIFMTDWHLHETHPYGNDPDDGGTGDVENARIRQCYAEIGGLPMDASVWSGQRYYSRKDIMITDNYYRDHTGFGAGVEGISLGFANLNVAWITGGDKNPATLTDGSDSIGKARLHGWDVQLNDIELGGAGSINVDGMFKRLTGDDSDDAVNGVFVDVEYNMPSFLFLTDGFAKVVGQYGKGAGAGVADWGLDNFGTFAHAAFYGNSAANRTAMKDFMQYRVIFFGLSQVNANLGIMPLVMYQAADNGDAADTKYTLLTVGLRAKYAITDFFAMQLEVGHDRSSKETSGSSVDAVLTKVTVAPTFTLGSGFWSRPEIRVYGTYGFWNDDAASGVGAASAADDKNAFQFGFQAEAWW